MATTAIFLTFTAVAYFTTLTLTCAQPQQQRRSAVAVTEIEALTAFKLNLRDPLGFLDDWDPSTPSAPCDWRGVLCYNHRVRDLRLPRLQLGGQLSNSLSKLTQLRRLSLHSNNLNGPIPLSLSNCLFFHAVYLRINSLSGHLPPPLLNLTNLQVLNLAHNLFSGKLSSSSSALLNHQTAHGLPPSSSVYTVS